MSRKQKITNLIRSRNFLYFLIAFIVASIIPLVLNSYLYIISTIVIFAIYASSWNFLANSGQGSLGHALFLGLGGFSSAIIGANISRYLAASLGLASMPVGAPLSIIVQIGVLLLGSLISAGVGLLIGLSCVRLKAWYLAMVTFGFSVIAVSISYQLDDVTHGIIGFATPRLVPTGFPYYFLTLCFALISIVVMFLIMKSRMGLAFRAIKENESEAKMIGINTTKYKLYAFVISTFFAGLAGGLSAYNYVGTIDNGIFSAENSFAPLIMSVIGGLGTIVGPVIGAAFYISIQQILKLSAVTTFLQHSIGSIFPNIANVGPPVGWLFIGVLLLVIVIFSPKGLISLFQKAYNYILTHTEEGPKKPKEAKK